MLILGGDVDSSRQGFSDILLYSFRCGIWLKIPTFMSDDINIVSRKHIEYLGVPIASKIGLASARIKSGFIYIVGGSSGHISDSLVKMYFPEDLCRLFDDNSEDCINFPGCYFCPASADDTSSSTCFFNQSAEDKCPGSSLTTTPLKATTFCNESWVSQRERECNSFENCGDCLAQFPVYGSSPIKSRCQVGGIYCTSFCV